MNKRRQLIRWCANCRQLIFDTESSTSVVVETAIILCPYCFSGELSKCRRPRSEQDTEQDTEQED